MREIEVKLASILYHKIPGKQKVTAGIEQLQVNNWSKRKSEWERESTIYEVPKKTTVIERPREVRESERSLECAKCNITSGKQKKQQQE